MFEQIACLVGYGVLYVAGAIIFGYIFFITMRFIFAWSRIRSVEQALEEYLGLRYDDDEKKFIGGMYDAGRINKRLYYLENSSKKKKRKKK
jgi:hypothetical protein